MITNEKAQSIHSGPKLEPYVKRYYPRKVRKQRIYSFSSYSESGTETELKPRRRSRYILAGAAETIRSGSQNQSLRRNVSLEATSVKLAKEAVKKSAPVEPLRRILPGAGVIRMFYSETESESQSEYFTGDGASSGAVPKFSHFRTSALNVSSPMFNIVCFFT